MSQVELLIEANKRNTDALNQLIKDKLDDMEEVEVDERLACWLSNLDINDTAQRKILSEGFTLDEILNSVDRQDLQRIGLRGGTEFRVWNAISKHRKNSFLCNGDINLKK